MTGSTGAPGPAGGPATPKDNHSCWDHVGNTIVPKSNGYLYGDGSTLDENIRHFRFSVIDYSGSDRTLWLNTNLVREAQFRVRQANDFTKVYRYTIAARANAVLDGLNTYFDVFVHSGLFHGTTSGLDGKVQVSFDDFNSFFSGTLARLLWNTHAHHSWYIYH